MNHVTIQPLAPDVVALLNGSPAVDAARLAKSRRCIRMDISALPADAQHFRTRVIPAVSPVITTKGVRWCPVVLNGQAVNHPITWTGDSSDDRDEAFALACYACDRFVIAEHLNSIGKVSLPLKDSATG